MASTKFALCDLDCIIVPGLFLRIGQQAGCASWKSPYHQCRTYASRREHQSPQLIGCHYALIVHDRPARLLTNPYTVDPVKSPLFKSWEGIEQRLAEIENLVDS